MSGQTTRSATRVKGFDSEEMDFQLIRQMGATSYQGASVGECLAQAQAIKGGDPDSWVESMASLGQAQKEDAQARQDKGHQVSARGRFLAACNSFRAAEYYAPFDGEQRQELGSLSRECFLAAMALWDHTCEKVAVPYDGAKLPGYFLTPAASAGPGKTVIIMSGFDGTCEESYLQSGAAALERGYRVLLFAGPGQVDCLRDNPGMAFVPDFEVPVGAAVNWLMGRPEVDPQRLALYGISFGGYFASRAAAHEPRIKALIANSPIIDLHAYMVGFIPWDPADMPDEMDFTPGDEPEDVLADPTYGAEKQRLLVAMARRFGRTTLKQTYIRMRDFVIGPAIKNIACPCLAMIGQGEGDVPGTQAEAFAAGVSGPVTVRKFTVAEGADSHCQVGNLPLSNAVIYDWLDELFGD